MKYIRWKKNCCFHILVVLSYFFITCFFCFLSRIIVAINNEDITTNINGKIFLMKQAIGLNRKGNTFLKSGNLDEALKCYMQASIAKPNSHAVQSNVLTTLIRLGKPLKAIEHAMKIGLIDSKTGFLNKENKLDYNYLKNKSNEQKKELSIYGILGVAFHNLDQLDLAVDSFRYALMENDKDGLTWLNLGDCLLHMRKANYSIWAYENALLVHNVSNDFSPLLRARSWLCDWRDRENLEILVYNAFKRIMANEAEVKIRATGDFLDVDAKYMLKQNKLLWKPHHEIPRLTTAITHSIIRKRFDHRKVTETLLIPPALKVGFISSDFGVHPVSSLIRGVLGFLNTSRIETYIFIYTKQTSWWRENITSMIPQSRTIDIFGLEKEAAAKLIQKHQIDILIDLNGLTLHSGLKIFGLRPSPIQISFLGFPMSTGTMFIDYFIGDKVAIDPAISTKDFTEHLVFTPSSFFVNDYAQLQSHVIWRKRPFASEIGLPSDKFIFASFSNFGKINPTIFTIWSNILKRTRNTVLWLLKHPGHEEASLNLKNELKRLGVDSRRLIFTDFQPWIHHILTKSIADLVLDTTLKNGHTSTTDALWAGVPVLTLCGKRMSVRIASSIIRSLSSNTPNSVSKLTIVSSLREYEEVAVEYANNRYLSRQLDDKIEKSRMLEDLFNTKTFTKSFEILLRNIHDMHEGYGGQRMHLYSGPVCMMDKSNKDKNMFANINKTLPTSSKCGRPNKILNYDMPYDPHTNDFYKKDARNIAPTDDDDRERLPVLIPKEEEEIKEKLIQFHYVNGRSSYKDWKRSTMKHFLKKYHGKRFDNSAVAIYVGIGTSSEYKYVKRKMSNIIKRISLLLKPGGKLFFLLRNMDMVIKLSKQILPQYSFCNIDDEKDKFGLFYEDEVYYEQKYNKNVKKKIFYLSALKCVRKGEEHVSVNVEIAGQAEII